MSQWIKPRKPLLCDECVFAGWFSCESKYPQCNMQCNPEECHQIGVCSVRKNINEMNIILIQNDKLKAFYEPDANEIFYKHLTKLGINY
jgi:hypothetical protein